jgi:hypothetical protein
MRAPRKIDVYLRRFNRWEYQYSTNLYSRCQDAVDDFLDTAALAGDALERKDVAAYFDKSWRRR